MMTGHRHSIWTPGLLRPLKSSETFEARSQQRHILRHWPKRGKKRSSFRVEEAHECARENGRAEREQKKRSSLKVVRPADLQKTSSYYEHIKKSRGAIRLQIPGSTVFRSIYIRHNLTSTNHGHLSIPCSCRRSVSSPL